MFENVGKKIQKLARVIFKLGLAVGIVWFIIAVIMFVSEADYLEYATVFGGSYYSSSLEEAGNTALSGLVGMICSILITLFALISSWPIYGFGIIVSKAENNKDDTDKLNSCNDVK